MSFTVKGRLDDSAYEVVVTGRREQPVVGDRRVAGLVTRWVGNAVAATPTGPVREVDGGDPRSILILLRAETDVLQVTGAAPRVEPVKAGVIR